MNSNGEKEPSKLLASSKSLLINLSSFKRGNRNLSKSIADLPSTLCSVTLTHFQSPTSGDPPAVAPTPTPYPLPEPSRIPAQQAAYRQVPASAIRPTRIPATLPPPVRPTLTPRAQHPPPPQRILPPTRTLPSRAPLNPPPAPARSAQIPNPLSPLGQKRKTLSEGGTRRLPPPADDLKRRRLDNEGFHQSSSTHSIPLPRAESSPSPDESSSIPRKVTAAQIPPPRRPMYRTTQPPPQLSTPDPPTTLPTPQPAPFRLSSSRPPPPTATIRPTHPQQRASMYNNNPATVPSSQPVKQPQVANTPQSQPQHVRQPPQQSVRLLQVNNTLRSSQPPPQQPVRPPPQVNTVQPQPQTQSTPITLQPKKNLTLPSGFGKRAHSLSIASVTQNGLALPLPPIHLAETTQCSNHPSLQRCSQQRVTRL